MQGTHGRNESNGDMWIQSPSHGSKGLHSLVNHGLPHRTKLLSLWWRWYCAEIECHKHKGRNLTTVVWWGWGEDRPIIIILNVIWRITHTNFFVTHKNRRLYTYIVFGLVDGGTIPPYLVVTISNCVGRKISLTWASLLATFCQVSAQKIIA